MRETVDRLILLLERFQMAIYARINRKKEAKWRGMRSRPIECILFDKPQLSTPIIEKNPILAIYFPMKIIVWEDNGCRVAFYDPKTLLQKHEPLPDLREWPDLRSSIIEALKP